MNIYSITVRAKLHWRKGGRYFLWSKVARGALTALGRGLENGAPRMDGGVTSCVYICLEAEFSSGEPDADGVRDRMQEDSETPCPARSWRD